MWRGQLYPEAGEWTERPLESFPPGSSEAADGWGWDSGGRRGLGLGERWGLVSAPCISLSPISE